MIWITKDREFIDDSQQQNRKYFMRGLQNRLPVCRTTNLVGQITNPAIMTSQRQSPASGLPLRRHCGQKPEFRPAKTANSGDP